MSKLFASVSNECYSVHNERNACAVIMVTIITEQPFAEVQDRFKLHGRRKRSATRWNVIESVLRSYGLELVLLPPSQYGSRTVNQLETELLFNEKLQQKLVVDVPRHVFACVNGSIEDWTKGSKRRIDRIYTVKKFSLDLDF